MKVFIYLIPIMFLFSGCCISFFDDTCVIERKVPGPTKHVYHKCVIENIPEYPERYGEPISFKQITFDDQVFYGITAEEAIDLYVNDINKKEYCSKLENIVNKFIIKDLNSTKP